MMTLRRFARISLKNLWKKNRKEGDAWKRDAFLLETGI